MISISALCFPFTDDQNGKDGILAMLSKNDFSSFRQSVKTDDVYKQFSGQKSLLHFTVASGDAESVKHVLSLGAEVNCTTARGYTPLIIAVLQRSVWKSGNKVFYEWNKAELLLEFEYINILRRTIMNFSCCTDFVLFRAPEKE